MVIWHIHVQSMYKTATRSLYRHMVCNVSVSCKAKSVGIQLGRGDTKNTKGH